MSAAVPEEKTCTTLVGDEVAYEVERGREIMELIFAKLSSFFFFSKQVGIYNSLIDVSHKFKRD